jgi:cobalt-zinc-cadmium efflux system membrane fusion protein
MKSLFFVAGIGVGAVALAAVSSFVLPPQTHITKLDETPPATAETREHSKNDSHAESGRAVLSDAQVQAAGITLGQVQGGILQHHFLVPGTIAPDADRVARVSVRLTGTVSELRKGLGDAVEKGEIVAIIESREVADAKSEYLAGRVTNDLQQTLAARLKTLWESRATSENDYLRARLAAQDAQIKLDSARQKLFALGLSDSEIAALPDQPVETLRMQSLRSPIRGRVADRRVDLGALVGREGQESELFIIVDLDQVWVDLAVSLNDLAKISADARITVTDGATGTQAIATVVFISPSLDKETRNARVIAKLSNPAHAWRPGSFVTAEIPLGGEPAKILIPKTALQTIKGDSVVFVREGDAFEARTVKTGREDDDHVEILSGIAVGEQMAVTNTFTLKAELGKSEAEHED